MYKFVNHIKLLFNRVIIENNKIMFSFYMNEINEKIKK